MTTTRLALMLLLTVAFFSIPSHATLGFDVSVPVTYSAALCLKKAGLKFAIVRGYHSYGAPDKNANFSVSNLRAAGIKYVDLYMFPCPKCSSTGAQQIAQLASAARGINFGMVWLDIEAPNLWLGSTSRNQAFFSSLYSAAKKSFRRVGIYSSKTMWTGIFGSSYSAAKSSDLWYAHYDNSASFSDFRSFGGWSKPAIKQYSSSGSQCGVGYDKNYY